MTKEKIINYIKVGLILSLSLVLVLVLNRFFIGDTPYLNKPAVVAMIVKTQGLLSSIADLVLQSEVDTDKTSDNLISRNNKGITWQEPKLKPTAVISDLKTNTAEIRPNDYLTQSESDGNLDQTNRVDQTQTNRVDQTQTNRVDHNYESDIVANDYGNDSVENETSQVNQETSFSSFSCSNLPEKKFSLLSANYEPDNFPLSGDLKSNPDVNLYLRGFEPNNEAKELIDRTHNYGLDYIDPPQISTVFKDKQPQIANTYHIFEWDFNKKKSLAPLIATPNFKVHMLGLKAVPGDKIYAPYTGRSIGSGKAYLVLFADSNNILLTNSRANALNSGYLVYFLDICVYPSLVNLYNSADSSGRTSLPALAVGEEFAVSRTNEVKIVVRDSMSFMDIRSRQDWWRK